MKASRSLGRRPIILIILMAIDGIAVAQCPDYSVEIIPGLPCKLTLSTAVATGLNEAGELCGDYGTCNEGGNPAVWLGDDWWITIDVPSEFLGLSLADINIHRHMSGTVAVSGTPTYERAAFIDFESGEVINLGLLPGGNRSFGHAINDAGTICGYSHNSVTGPLRAFVWEGEVMSALKLPVGPESVANDIANDGSICGWMGDSPVDSHAFRWKAGNVQDLGVIPNGQSARAHGISSDGQRICGDGVVPHDDNGELTLHAFHWSDGVMTDLGTLPGLPRSSAEAVNDNGQVVGQSFNTDLVGHSFIWQGGIMTELNDLVDPALALDIDQVYSINNAGQIAGQAKDLTTGDIVAVRLTPIPALPGDFNCDHIVNVDDLLAVITHWSYETPNLDFDQSGQVGVGDLLIVLDNWSL